MITGDSLQQQSKIFDTAITSNPSQWRFIWQRFRKHRLGMIGLISLLAMLVLVMFGPIFFTNPYPSINPDYLLWNAPVGTVDQSNGHMFIFGSDRFGRDYFALVLKASQFTFLVAFVPAILVLIIGFTLGAVSGYFGGWFDTVLMLITDFLLMLPLLPACIIATNIISQEISRDAQAGPEWVIILLALIVAFTLFGWVGICRLVRGLVLSLRTENFVEAAQALGASTPRILFHHLLPNTSGALLVAGTLAIGDFAVLETVLAYFGLGIHDNEDRAIGSLGTVLAGNSDMVWFVKNLNPFEDIRGYLILFPTIFLIIIVVAINFIGDALRDVFDPRAEV